MFKFIDVEQGTDDWFDLRAGKLTSSKLGVVMANYPKAFGNPAKQYAVNIAIEQITGNPIQSNFSNDHMLRGIEQEPIARMLYERESFCKVTNGGFFQSDFIGCSPDGMVNNDGVIEIKSVIAPVHFASIKRNTFDPAYKWQCIANMKFTGSDWLDFISFCADFPVGKQLFIHRLEREDYAEEFKIIDERVAEFKILVDESKQFIIENN